MADSARWIAIVDDDPSVLRALGRSLRVHVHQTKAYASAQEFLDSLPGGLPACLILDIQMPVMTGLELHLHLTGKGVHIPTIIITSHADPIVRERLHSAGVVAFLTKPLQNASLFAAIDAAIGDGGRVRC
jgi:FixJ family two-component response regulator